MAREVECRPKQRREACVVVLCGLPGSGKSTLAAAILSLYGVQETTTTLPFDEVVLIDYDDIASRLSSTDPVCSDREAWRRTRVVARTMLRETLHRHFCTTPEEDSPRGKRMLVVLDDNFHLRSMRRDIYKVCLELFNSSSDSNDNNNNGNHAALTDDPTIIIGFVVLFMNTPLSICLARNAARTSGRVPNHVIETMATNIEVPTKRVLFEKHSILLKNEDEITTLETDGILDEKERWLKNVDECIRQSLCHSLVTAAQHLKQNQRKDKEKERTTNSSLLWKRKKHRTDLLLRTLVGVVCRNCGHDGGDTVQRVNEIRKTILRFFRNTNENELGSVVGEDETVFHRFLIEFESPTTNDGDRTRQEREMLQSLLEEAYTTFCNDHPL